MTLPIIGTPAGLAFRTGQPQVFDAAGLAQFDEKINPGLAAGLKSGCFIPLSIVTCVGTMESLPLYGQPFHFRRRGLP